MSKKINEGVVNWILQKAIGLVAGGDYRKAVKAFKGDKNLQKDLVKMAKNRQDFEKKLNNLFPYALSSSYHLSKL